MSSKPILKNFLFLFHIQTGGIVIAALFIYLSIENLYKTTTEYDLSLASSILTIILEAATMIAGVCFIRGIEKVEMSLKIAITRNKSFYLCISAKTSIFDSTAYHCEIRDNTRGNENRYSHGARKSVE
jgi:hypothetical protein